MRQKKATAPEERPASEAVQVLVGQCQMRIQQEIETLGALALRDAKLDPKDGWRFDVGRCVYVKVS